jgi:hypothetical protein
MIFLSKASNIFMDVFRLNLSIPLAVCPCETGTPLEDPANVAPARHKFPGQAESSSGLAHQRLVGAGSILLLSRNIN